MENTKEKRKRKYSRQTIWIAAILSVAAVYTGVTIAIQRGDLAARKDKNRKLTTEIEELRGQLEDLERQKAYIGTDAYVEKKAREQLGFVKKGEILFKVQEDGQIDVYRSEKDEQ